MSLRWSCCRHAWAAPKDTSFQYWIAAEADTVLFFFDVSLRTAGEDCEAVIVLRTHKHGSYCNPLRCVQMLAKKTK